MKIHQIRKPIQCVAALAVMILLAGSALAAVPQVTTRTESNVDGNSATLRGKLDNKGGASTVTVFFQYGTTTSYGSQTGNQSRSSTGNFDDDISGLLPGTTYHYRAVAVNSSGTDYGNDESFTTSPAPTVATSAASSITTTGARLNGNLSNTGGTTTASVSFEYGLTASYGTTTSTQTMWSWSTGSFNKSISGLTPGTLYHFRAKATNSNGTAYGSDMTFITDGPPTVVTSAASSIAATAATLNGSLTAMGSATPITVSFEWGTTTSYGSNTSGQALTATGAFSANLTGLTAGQTYHFRTKATGSDGTAYGADQVFVTPAPPAVSTSAADTILETSARLNGNLTALGGATPVTVCFEYGLTTGYGSTTAGQPRTTTGAFQANLSGLTPGATYNFRAKAASTTGTVYGTNMTFRVRTAPVVTTSAVSSLMSTTATLNGSLTDLGTATPVTVNFEYGTTTAYGSTTSDESRTATGGFSAGVTGLVPGTLYHYRAKASSAHGLCCGPDMVFTAKLPPTVTTAAATLIAETSATMNGDLTVLGSASPATVCFEYGTSPSYGSTTSGQPLTATGSFSAAASGLTPGTIYYCRAKATSDAGVAYGANVIFITLKRPTISSSDASNVTSNAAVLNGNLTDLGTATPIAVSFEYGRDLTYGSETPAVPMTAPGACNAAITGLSTGTTYYFRAKATGAHGTSYGGSESFMTQPGPSIATRAATSIQPTSARLNGEVLDFSWLGGIFAIASFDYGTTTAYGTTTGDVWLTTWGEPTYSTAISGLTPGTTYHFRARVRNLLGLGSVGDDMTFVYAVPPTVATTAATNVAAATATLNGNLSSLGSATPVEVSFQYGLTVSYGSVTAPESRTLSGAFSADIAGLEGNKTYHFRAKATSAGGTAYGADMTFTTTGLPPEVTTSGAEALNNNKAELRGALTSLGSATSVAVSFDYGTAPGVYDHESPATTLTAPGPFTWEFKDLTSGNTYYFRAKADAGANGEAVGAEMFLAEFTLTVVSNTNTGIHNVPVAFSLPSAPEVWQDLHPNGKTDPDGKASRWTTGPKGRFRVFYWGHWVNSDWFDLPASKNIQAKVGVTITAP